jgi:hypothetical protein
VGLLTCYRGCFYNANHSRTYQCAAQPSIFTQVNPPFYDRVSEAHHIDFLTSLDTQPHLRCPCSSMHCPRPNLPPPPCTYL